MGSSMYDLMPCWTQLMNHESFFYIIYVLFHVSKTFFSLFFFPRHDCRQGTFYSFIGLFLVRICARLGCKGGPTTALTIVLGF